MVAKIFLSRLMRLHPAIWVKLGKPHVMMKTFKYFGYLWRKDFNSLPDDKIVVVGRAVRFFTLLQFVLFIFMLVLFVPLAIHNFHVFFLSAGHMAN